jgi:hexokinase
MWTKSFRGRGLLGQDVVGALKAAFAERGIAARIPAIMNDTVATLVALRYSQPTTRAGIILGTGASG